MFMENGEQNYSIHDIAAQLIFLEPTDINGLSDLKDKLNNIINRLPANLQTFIIEAVEKIDCLLEGNNQEPNSMLFEIGMIIDNVLKNLEYTGEKIENIKAVINVQKQPENISGNEINLKQEDFTIKTEQLKETEKKIEETLDSILNFGFKNEIEKKLLTNFKNEPAIIHEPEKKDLTTFNTSFIEINSNKLDNLIEILGEFVVSHSTIVQDELVSSGKYLEFSQKVMHSGKILSDLQNLCMSLRMVDIRNMFQRLEQVIRDNSKKSNKNIEFITSGDKIEIDRNLFETVYDLLVQIINNSIYYGIESSQEREQKGKLSKAYIKLSANRSFGNIVFEITDDGRGLDKLKIVQIAIKKGLISTGCNLSDNDIFNLILKPGFSFNDELTANPEQNFKIDIIKKRIDSLGGKINIISQLDKGCTFLVMLPVTLSISDSMIVKIGDERYIIPNIGIFITLKPEPGMIFNVNGKGEMLNIKGEIIPIFRLYSLFDIKGATEDLLKGILIIVEDGNKQYALFVDEIIGQQQVVIKSLGDVLGKVEGISGGTIMGDGKVGLILDIAEIVDLFKQKEKLF